MYYNYYYVKGLAKYVWSFTTTSGKICHDSTRFRYKINPLGPTV